MEKGADSVSAGKRSLNPQRAATERSGKKEGAVYAKKKKMGHEHAYSETRPAEKKGAEGKIKRP